MEEEDSRKIRIEFHKADAIRELRPHLDFSDGAPSGLGPKAAMRYLSRVVYAHLESLLEAYPIPPGVDIPAFTDRAIQDALDHVNNPALEEIARSARVYLVDATRATYLGALAARKTRYTSPSPFGAFDHDHDYETWSRTACEGFLTKFHTHAVDAGAATPTLIPRRPCGDAPAGSTGQNAQGCNIEQLKHDRLEVLVAYKRDTGVSSDYAIYHCAGRAGTHSCHKPQFLQWKNGLLRSDSAPCISLENFLKERRLPPRDRSDD